MTLMEIILISVVFAIFNLQLEPTPPLVLTDTPQGVIDTATPLPIVTITVEQSSTIENTVFPTVISNELFSTLSDENNSNFPVGSSLFQDLFVEFCGAVVFAGIVGWVLYRLQRRIENSEQLKVSNESKRRYLTNMKAEIDENLRLIEPIFRMYQEFSEKENDLLQREELYRTASGIVKVWMEPMSHHSENQRQKGVILKKMQEHFFTTVLKQVYWEALIPSGLLPALVDEILLKEIADFYYDLRVIEISTVKELGGRQSFDEWGYRLTTALPTVVKIFDKGHKVIENLDKEIEKLS